MNVAVSLEAVSDPLIAPAVERACEAVGLRCLRHNAPAAILSTNYHGIESSGSLEKAAKIATL